MALQNKAQEVLSYLGAIQTLTEKFPMSFKINYVDFPTSFDFMIDILKLLGVDNRELVQKIASLVADDEEGGFLDVLEIIVKNVLKLNVSKLLSCEANPIIPDTMIGPPPEKNFDREPFGPNELFGGFDIDMGLIDVMGYLRHAPLSAEGKHYYNDTDYKVNELYKSTDFNTFLWYVINKGMSVPKEERKKLIWDNRFLVGLSGENDEYKTKWFADEIDKRKKIIELYKEILKHDDWENLTEEDLVEAIALGHDLGHTPFGHAGERELDKLCPDGFRHNERQPYPAGRQRLRRKIFPRRRRSGH